MVYEYIRTLTIRGSKVKKIVKDIKSYELLFGSSSFPLPDLSDSNPEEIEKFEIQYYSLNDCTKNIKEFIDDIFERRKYGKGDFKKKAFSGAKIILVLKYVDQQILRAERNIIDLKSNLILTSDDPKCIFDIYWSQQLDSLQLIKNIILSHYITIDNDEKNIAHRAFLEFIKKD